MSMDLDSHPKSKLMSLVTQTISLFKSTDLESLPKPLSDLISLITQTISTHSDPMSDFKLVVLIDQTLALKPSPELVSLIRQIVSVVATSKNSKLISLRLRGQVFYENGTFRSMTGEVSTMSNNEWNYKWKRIWEEFRLTEEDATFFHCMWCNGEYHQGYEKTPAEIKHSLHPKHSLSLVSLGPSSQTRECYCCDENLKEVFYYCSPCDYAMNIACVEKPLALFKDHPKWHEHTLSLFPRRASLTCNLCALPDSSSPIYMCPPCDFVVHLRCTHLPRVIRISRHPHRISFTSSFNQGDWTCSVCRKGIDNDYGGYSCIKDGCSYAVHSRCATQSNVWDGVDLEGVPEEIEDEEEVEPFIRISDGVIRHFSHDDHHLRLDENIGRDYDENMQCQICIAPIYFGNFYSCVQCEFLLHETCANLSRRMYHPIHPHPLTLAQAKGSDREDSCSACVRTFTSGFFYKCGKIECIFHLHVQCATVYEPLFHGSHAHPLFLTSKPGEWRLCSVCRFRYANETFNCIECDGFALCFGCATIPSKVRYKHDKHILTLSYGSEETSTVTYWCEACETKIRSGAGERFYMCDEYCSVTLHIDCLLELDLYIKPGSSSSVFGKQVRFLPNNKHMSRPICSKCEKRCPRKIVFQCSGIMFCSMRCLDYFFKRVL